METIMTHFDRLMAAITFAEENELEFTGDRKPAKTAPTQATKMTGGTVLTNQTAH